MHKAQECRTHRPWGASAPTGSTDLGHPSRPWSPVLLGNAQQPLPLLPRRTSFPTTNAFLLSGSPAPASMLLHHPAVLLECTLNTYDSATRANVAFSAPGHSRHLSVFSSSLILRTLKHRSVRPLYGKGHGLGQPGFKSWLCPYHELMCPTHLEYHSTCHKPKFSVCQCNEASRVSQALQCTG